MIVLGVGCQYVRRSQLPSQVLDDELVVLDSEHDVFFSSNAVGAHIWQQLERPASLESLTTSILDTFDGADREIVKADASELLQQMLDKRLIEIVS